MSAMSTVETLSRPVTTRPSAPWAALVLIAAELVLGWFTYDIAVKLGDDRAHLHLIQWFVMMLPYLPLALLAALAGRTGARGILAGGLGLVAGAAGIGYYELTVWLFTHGHQPSIHVSQGLQYASVMVLATLAALAWGVSRRHGRLWLTGLVVAPAAAALTLWSHWTSHLGLHQVALSDTNGIRQLYLIDTIATMIPVVLGCLVCWLLELRESGADAAAPS
jgi:hypothetical protein